MFQLDKGARQALFFSFNSSFLPSFLYFFLSFFLLNTPIIFLSLSPRLNNRGTILGPSDLEWWLSPSTSPWNNSSFSPVGGTRAQDPRPEQFLRIQFAVVVDTSFPSIQRQLTDGFKTAERMLRERKGFCLEVGICHKLLPVKSRPDWLKLSVVTFS